MAQREASDIGQLPDFATGIAAGRPYVRSVARGGVRREGAGADLANTSDRGVGHIGDRNGAEPMGTGRGRMGREIDTRQLVVS
jgi:hypothetical protein